MIYKIIPISNGKDYAKVSIEDYECISQFNWHMTGNGYCFRWLPRNGSKTKRAVMMHRFILNASKGKEVDHINSDKMDNRRENIRLSSRGQNQQKAIRKSKNKYRGVRKSNQKWAARIHFNKKEIYLGLYNTEECAAKAYDLKALELHGEHALVNFHK